MLWFRPPPEGAEQGDRESSTGILENLPRNKKRAGGGCGGRRSRTEGGESPSTPHRDNAGFKASFLTPKRVTFKVPSGGLSEKEGEETGC